MITENQNVVFEKKNNRGWLKKDKKIDWNTSFNKRFYILQASGRSLYEKVAQLNQLTLERSLLIHGQINFIFVKLNKFDNVYNKIWKNLL